MTLCQAAKERLVTIKFIQAWLLLLIWSKVCAMFSNDSNIDTCRLQLAHRRALRTRRFAIVTEILSKKVTQRYYSLSSMTSIYHNIQKELGFEGRSVFQDMRDDLVGQRHSPSTPCPNMSRWRNVPSKGSAPMTEQKILTTRPSTPPPYSGSAMSNLPQYFERLTDEENGKYEIEDAAVLGYGGNGKAVLVRKRSTHQLRVCKIIHNEEGDDWETYLTEVKILRDLLPPSERILRFDEAFRVSPTRCQIYTEYCDQGDLYKLVGRYMEARRLIPESFIWHIFLQLSEALAYIHYGYHHKIGTTIQHHKGSWPEIIHADMKPDNVFLRSSRWKGGYPDIVLGDFGSAILLRDM